MSRGKKKRLKKVVASVTATITASALAVLSPTAGYAATIFKDVPASEYFYEAVNQLQADNIIEGNADGTYRPYDPLTRAQAAKIIALALDLDTTNIQDPGFKDVTAAHFAYKYISTLAKEGIVEGYNDTFNPNDPLTRAQMAKMISLAYNLQSGDLQQTSFTDVKPGDWFAKYVDALVESGITTGTTATTFAPNDKVTRGQMAAFVYRSENKVAEEAGVQETIANITTDTLVTAGGTYTLSDELKKWINPGNLAALQGAVITFMAKDHAIATIQRIELTAKGKASTNSSDPYGSHVVFDGTGATVAADLTVNGDYITLKNVTIQGNLHIGKGVANAFFSEFTKVTGKTTIDDAVPTANRTVQAKSVVRISALEETNRGRVVFSEFQLGNVDIDKDAEVIFLSKTTGASIGEIVVKGNAVITADPSVTISKVTIDPEANNVVINANATTVVVTSNTTKLTLGTNVKIVNLILPAGLKPSDVFENYDEIKENITQVNGIKHPETTPTTPSNTGGSTPQAPAAPQGIQAVGLSVVLANDGKITGLSAVQTYQYKLAADSTWTNIAASSTEVTGLAPGSYQVRIAANGNTPASPATDVTVSDTYLLEAVTLDGKDGVSSQDGKMETIRLKFAANIDGSTVTNSSFAVSGFTVESVKVTDKNGRTAPDPLYTAGENKYITIRVTPADGTHYTPTVTQQQGSVIEDSNEAEIVGIHVQAKDQAAPVIIEAEYADNDQNGMDAGDQIVIHFSEDVNLSAGSTLADLVDDFTLQETAGTPFLFNSDDQFAISENQVTVTLGATTQIEPDTSITISSSGVSLEDQAKNKAKPQKAFVDPTVFSEPKSVEITDIPAYVIPVSLQEAITLDGKDGVSSQDGQFETIRLKLSANIDESTVTNDSFIVPGFTVESIKVTDKNGRTAPDPLYTVGEKKYITIRVTPAEGTHFTPTVKQSQSSVIELEDMAQTEVTGIYVRVNDQAAPVITEAAFIDNGQNGVNQGDQVVIHFSEEVVLSTGGVLADLGDNFTLYQANETPFSFNADDQFVISGNTVTVTLGATTQIGPGSKITISSSGVTLEDQAGNKAKPQKAFVDPTVYSDPKTIAITNLPPAQP